MKASEVIAALKALMEEYGDVEVVCEASEEIVLVEDVAFWPVHTSWGTDFPDRIYIGV